MPAQISKPEDKMELPIRPVIKETVAKLPDARLVAAVFVIWRMKIAAYTLPVLLKKNIAEKLPRKAGLNAETLFSNGLGYA